MRSVRVLMFLLQGAVALGRAIIYLTCLVAVHLSVAALARWGRLTPGRNPSRRRNDAALVGAVASLIWAVFLTLLIALATGWRQMLVPFFLFSLPVGLIVGVQVGRWRNATFWGAHRSTLVLGERRTRPFFLTLPSMVNAEERTKHLWVLGATGSGKSTLLHNLILSDLRAGGGLCVVDPKDNLIDGLLPHIPRAREQDVVLLDATDTDHPLGFNPLAGIPASRRSLAASEIITVFKRYFAASWGARMEHILTNVVLALLEYPEATLLDIHRMLVAPTFAQAVIAHSRNPGVRQFFATEFESYITRKGEALGPILNKIGRWLSYPELRNIVGQPRSSFNLREVMDQGKILLVRIPAGSLGEKISSLLAALVTTKIQLAAHSRVDLPEERRRFFSLYVDEFQRYANSSFERMLTEARAFKLGLVCANQYPEQLTRELQLAL